MNVEGHLEVLKETFLALDTCIDKGIANYQRTIGFHTSLGAVEMLELYLHKMDLLSLSARLNHTWMKSLKKIQERVPFDFPRKDEIVRLVYYVEKNRDDLCYGKPVELRRIQEQLEHFHRLREIFREVGLHEV